MAVYIDNFYITGGGKFGRMQMSHMIADSSKELISMAIKIGVNPKWIQYPGTYKEHFDVCISKRKKAIKMGAIETPYRQLGEMIAKRKKRYDRAV